MPSGPLCSVLSNSFQQSYFLGSYTRLTQSHLRFRPYNDYRTRFHTGEKQNESPQNVYANKWRNYQLLLLEQKLYYSVRNYSIPSCVSGWSHYPANGISPCINLSSSCKITSAISPTGGGNSFNLFSKHYFNALLTKCLFDQTLSHQFLLEF